jgi:hypothetical protein
MRTDWWSVVAGTLLGSAMALGLVAVPAVFEALATPKPPSTAQDSCTTIITQPGEYRLIAASTPGGLTCSIRRIHE